MSEDLNELFDAVQNDFEDELRKFTWKEIKFSISKDQAAELFSRLEAKEVLVRAINAKYVVEEQANDEGLWFEPLTAPEAYLMAELRRLHRAIEAI